MVTLSILPFKLIVVPPNLVNVAYTNLTSTNGTRLADGRVTQIIFYLSQELTRFCSLDNNFRISSFKPLCKCCGVCQPLCRLPGALVDVISLPFTKYSVWSFWFSGTVMSICGEGTPGQQQEWHTALANLPWQ